MMRQQLINMLTLQDKMNSKVNADWVKQNFAWYRAVWLECGELVEHHGYKWWKHQEPEMDQVRLEIVDIWHFGMSMLFDGRSIEAIAEEMLFEISNQELDMLSIVDATEMLAEKVLVTRKFKMIYFWQLLFAACMSFDDLYKQYIGKNVLNFFRQDHGYKDGSYIKVWNGREDNEHLTEIQNQLDASASDFSAQMYNELKARYETVTNSKKATAKKERAKTNKASVKKTATKTTSKKATIKKQAAKKPTVKKAAAKNTPSKQSASKKATAKKPATKK